ncbi:MAG: FtsX-like permease family protein [Pseudomonadota bacterium]
MSTFSMAWRNVWRNARRSLVTIGAMGLALFAMINYNGLVAGFLKQSESKLLDLELGDMQIFATGFRDKPSLYTNIAKPDELLDALGRAGFRGSARLTGAGLAASGDSSAGVILTGLDIARDRRVTRLGEYVGQGAWLADDDPHGVVIGRQLAKILDVQAGGELVILTQAADGSMANDVFKIRGVLKGVSAMIDRATVFLPARTFRELLVFDQGAHQVIVRLPDGANLAAGKQKVQALAAGLEVKTWRELAPTLASIMDSSAGMMAAMSLIVYLAISIVILNAMLMAVFERIREFGVLKALGVGPGRVFWLIMVESAIQTFLAVLGGALLAGPSLFYLRDVGIDLGTLGGIELHGVAFDPIWRVYVTGRTFVQPIATLLFAVALAVLYPALKAALIRPVAAIRYH